MLSFVPRLLSASVFVLMATVGHSEKSEYRSLLKLLQTQAAILWEMGITPLLSEALMASHPKASVQLKGVYGCYSLLGDQWLYVACPSCHHGAGLVTLQGLNEQSMFSQSRLRKETEHRH